IFFFQAEDGIRVFHVTGVQTCALPICPCAPPTRRGAPGRNPCCKPASTWSEYADPRGTPRLSPSKARGEGKRATRGALVPPARGMRSGAPVPEDTIPQLSGRVEAYANPRVLCLKGGVIWRCHGELPDRSRHVREGRDGAPISRRSGASRDRSPGAL